MEVLVYLFFVGIGVIISFMTIRAAIDNSKTAEEITEIRELLQILVKNSTDIHNQDRVDQEKELENYEILDTPYDSCPACGANISQEAVKCPSCGITLK